MSDILDKEIWRSLSLGGGTKAQASDGILSMRDGGKVEDAPGAKTQEMVLPVMARQGT